MLNTICASDLLHPCWITTFSSKRWFLFRQSSIFSAKDEEISCPVKGTVDILPWLCNAYLVRADVRCIAKECLEICWAGRSSSSFVDWHLGCSYFVFRSGIQTILSEKFNGFLPSFQANLRSLTQLGNDRFLLNPFQFFPYKSFCQQR
jgi:hypothetical protein